MLLKPVYQKEKWLFRLCHSFIHAHSFIYLPPSFNSPLVINYITLDIRSLHKNNYGYLLKCRFLDFSSDLVELDGASTLHF